MKPAIKKGDLVYRVVECDLPDAKESTWAVASVELIVVTAKRHVLARNLSGISNTNYAPSALGRLYFATPDEAIQHFVDEQQTKVKNAETAKRFAERALQWAHGKVKVCTRCMYAKRGASYQCRKCEAVCCEHLCGFKTVPKGAGELSSATCSACSREPSLFTRSA